MPVWNPAGPVSRFEIWIQRAARGEFHLGLLALALATTLAPGNAAVAGAIGQEDVADAALLRRAEVRLELLDATRARIDATFELASVAPTPILITWFPGQTLDQIVVVADGVAVEPVLSDRQGAIRVLELPGSPSIVNVRYRVSVDGAYAYRFPLPVPSIPADPAADSVVLWARLPEGAEYDSNSFPHFLVRQDDAMLRADLVAVPGFVHLVFGASPAVEGRPSAGVGFGANFYGFFLFGAVWCFAYFGWAVLANRRERG